MLLVEDAEIGPGNAGPEKFFSGCDLCGRALPEF
jgi:hypothetical protein